MHHILGEARCRTRGGLCADRASEAHTCIEAEAHGQGRCNACVEGLLRYVFPILGETLRETRGWAVSRQRKITQTGIGADTCTEEV